MSRKTQCPATRQGGAIRPPRPGIPSCGTRHLGSVRSVLAKQGGYQASFLLSFADGSSESSAASPRCGMASLLGLWSHHRLFTGCGHIALPIVLIGASLMVVACRSLLGPPQWAGRLDYGRSTTFTLSLESITETGAAGILQLCATRYRAHAAREPQFLQGDWIAGLPRTTHSRTNDPLCPSSRPSRTRLLGTTGLISGERAHDGQSERTVSILHAT
jgi:hypothetical protein